MGYCERRLDLSLMDDGRISMNKIIWVRVYVGKYTSNAEAQKKINKYIADE